ncbi:MAG: GNAT family N-acetyltransferase [Promethearchaeota archaeon]|nr:MAG: GNAT family N-acetyltransferase [Candidatus Lokiarchaeota archaeon]
MKIKIRKANAEDAKEISYIWEIICAERKYTAVSKPFTAEQERRYINNLTDREGIFVAEKEGQIIGFQSLDKWAEYSDSFDHVGVIGTFVLPEWRKKNIGYKLAQFTFNLAKEHDYEKFVIYVRAGNSGAIRFYENLGFIQKGVLSNQVKINGIYEDEIFMEMFL